VSSANILFSPQAAARVDEAARAAPAATAAAGSLRSANAVLQMQ
jgi:hypothetical protein